MLVGDWEVPTTPAEVRTLLQNVFSIASRQSRDDKFADRLGAALSFVGIAYVRGGKSSMREWLSSIFCHWARQNANTIVSILRVLG